MAGLEGIHGVGTAMSAAVHAFPALGPEAPPPSPAHTITTPAAASTGTYSNVDPAEFGDVFIIEVPVALSKCPRLDEFPRCN